jgi:hypothetical protein
VIATGQHTNLVDDLIHQSGMRIDANLRVSEPRDGTRPSLTEMFARVMVGIDRIWSSQTVPEEYRADGRREVGGAVACLVHGDTSSAAAAALASFNLRIPVVHVEAGLRTSNLLAPFPEEGNRQLISRIAALHLAPTTTNKMNLVREGVDYDRVLVTGNTSIDMLRWASDQQGGYGPARELGCRPRTDRGCRAPSQRAVPGDQLRGAGPPQSGCQAAAARRSHRPPQRAARRTAGLRRLRASDGRRTSDHHRLRRRAGGSARSRHPGARRP